MDPDFKQIKDSLDGLLMSAEDFFPDDPLATLRLRIIKLTLEFLNLMSQVDDKDFETQKKYIPLCSVICQVFSDFLIYERTLRPALVGDEESEFDQFEDMFRLLKDWQIKAEA
jgi:hypothetical protein